MIRVHYTANTAVRQRLATAARVFSHHRELVPAAQPIGLGTFLAICRCMQLRLMCMFAMLSSGVVATWAQDQQFPTTKLGGAFTYAVQPADSLASIASRFGVSSVDLIEANQLSRPYQLTVGQLLAVDNSHLAVIDSRAAITINIPQRMLFFSENGTVDAFPVTVGARGWPTPLGAFTIVDKETDPVWDVPVSIQREMAAQGRPIVTRVPASPANPLGAHWLRLSLPGIGIHGTNAPSSIYRFVSHGCVRMHPDDIAALFSRVRLGTTGTIIYQPVIVWVSGGGVWLEANPDPYRRFANPLRFVVDAVHEYGVAERVDWDVVKLTLRLQRGRPVDVTRAQQR